MYVMYSLRTSRCTALRIKTSSVSRKATRNCEENVLIIARTLSACLHVCFLCNFQMYEKNKRRNWKAKYFFLSFFTFFTFLFHKRKIILNYNICDVEFCGANLKIISTFVAGFLFFCRNKNHCFTCVFKNRMHHWLHHLFTHKSFYLLFISFTFLALCIINNFVYCRMGK